MIHSYFNNKKPHVHNQINSQSDSRPEPLKISMAQLLTKISEKNAKNRTIADNSVGEKARGITIHSSHVEFELDDGICCTSFDDYVCQKIKALASESKQTSF